MNKPPAPLSRRLAFAYCEAFVRQLALSDFALGSMGLPSSDIEDFKKARTIYEDRRTAHFLVDPPQRLGDVVNSAYDEMHERGL